MSKQRKNTRCGNATTPRAGTRRAAVAAIVLLAVAIGVPLGFGWWRAEHADTRPTAPSTQPTGAPARYDGRVEHLVSGQVARFHSLEELLACMIRVLADVQHQADAP